MVVLALGRWRLVLLWNQGYDGPEECRICARYSVSSSLLTASHVNIPRCGKISHSRPPRHVVSILIQGSRKFDRRVYGSGVYRSRVLWGYDLWRLICSGVLLRVFHLCWILAVEDASSRAPVMLLTWLILFTYTTDWVGKVFCFMEFIKSEWSFGLDESFSTKGKWLGTKNCARGIPQFAQELYPCECLAV